MTQVGRDVLTLLLHAPAIFSGVAGQAADVLGLALLPAPLREAASLSILQPTDAVAAQHAVEAFGAFWANKEQSAAFAQVATPHILADIEHQIGTDNFRSAILSVANNAWVRGERPTGPNLVANQLNLSTLLLLATELRTYPRSIALDPIVLVRFRRARDALWSPTGALGRIFDVDSSAARESASVPALTNTLRACVL